MTSAVGFIIISVTFLILWFWLFLAMIVKVIQVSRLRRSAVRDETLMNDPVPAHLEECRVVFHRCRVYPGRHNSFYAAVTADGDTIYMEARLENTFIALPKKDIRDISVKMNRICPFLSFLVLEHDRAGLVSPLLLEPDMVWGWKKRLSLLETEKI